MANVIKCRALIKFAGLGKLKHNISKFMIHTTTPLNGGGVDHGS